MTTENSMSLIEQEKAMQKAQSEGYDSAASRSPLPAEYAADDGLKAAWEYGLALAENDGPNYWSRYHGAAR